MDLSALGPYACFGTVHEPRAAGHAQALDGNRVEAFDVTSHLFTLALSLSLEMGPHTRVPLVHRLRQAAPAASEEDLRAALVAAQAASEFAARLGREVMESAISDADALSRLSEAYPNLGPDIVMRLRGHGYFLALH